MYLIFLLLFIVSLFFIPYYPYVMILSAYFGIMSEKHADLRNAAHERFMDEIKEFENLK